jgi:hypothetical protein
VLDYEHYLPVSVSTIDAYDVDDYDEGEGEDVYLVASMRIKALLLLLC